MGKKGLDAYNDSMIILNFIIILFGACFAQVFLREELPTDKMENFIVHFTGCKHETYEKFEYMILPIIGASCVLLFINPQGILAQASSGLAWSTTICAIYNKATKHE